MNLANRLNTGLLLNKEPDKDTGPTFYATPELTQRLNLIRHLLQNSEQLLLVLAEEGCGKTSLLKQLVANTNPHWKLFTPTGSPTLGEEALLNHLLASFNVRPEGKPLSALREALRSHIAATRYNGLLPVLLVDDAHMLPLETLSLLVRLVMTGEPQTRMRVLLFCEPQITSLFAAPEFEIMRNTLIHTLDIPPLTEKQLAGYLQSRFNQARYSSGNPVTDSVLRQIYAETEGVPGRIEPLAQKLLSRPSARPGLNPTAAATPSPALDWSALRRRLPLLLSLAAVFLLLVLLISWVKSAWFSGPDANDSQALALPLPPATAGEEVLLTPLPSQPAPVAVVAPVVAVAAETEPAALVPEPRAEAALEAEPETAEAEPTSTPSALSAEDMSDLAGVKSAAWLSKQDPAKYTIQILSTNDKTAVTRFLGRYGLQDDLAIFSATVKNSLYHKLVYGFYDDRAQAKQALENLPADLRRNTQPWVRALGEIQQELKTH